MPMPMAPPLEGQPVVAGRTRRWRRAAQSPAVWASSTTIAPSGSSAPTTAATWLGVEVAGRAASGRPAAAGRRPRPAAPTGVGQRLQRADRVVALGGERVDLAALGHQVAGLAGVGEERHRRPGVDEHEVPHPASCISMNSARYARRSTVGTARARARGGRGRSRPAASPRWPRRPGRRRPGPRSRQRRAADQQRSRLARAQRRGRRRRPGASATAVAPGRRRRAPPAERAVDHDTSAGRISVATWPGGPSAAATASAASLADVRGDAERPHPARHVAGRPPRCRSPAARRTACGRWRGRRRCSPAACAARRALCRLAKPLARPGPRCSSVAAGRSAMRP